MKKKKFNIVYLFTLFVLIIMSNLKFINMNNVVYVFLSYLVARESCRGD